jgi:hypothetical protein
MRNMRPAAAETAVLAEISRDLYGDDKYTVEDADEKLAE